MRGVLEGQRRKVAAARIGLVQKACRQHKARRLLLQSCIVPFHGNCLRRLRRHNLRHILKVAREGRRAHPRLGGDAPQQLLALGGALGVFDDRERLGDIFPLFVRLGKVVLAPRGEQAEVDERHRRIEARLIPLRPPAADDVVGVQSLGQGHHAHPQSLLTENIQPPEIGLLPRKIAVVADEHVLGIPH